MARVNNQVARESLVGFEQMLRGQISSGEYAPGDLLPGIRTLAERHEVGRRLVQSALRSLEVDELIAAEPRRGYRVLPGAGGAGAGSAIAFLVPRVETEEVAGYHGALLDELQRAAVGAGHPLLVVGGKSVGRDDVVEQLESHGVRGVVINSHDPKLLEAVRGLRVPVVAVDVWHPEMEMDTVIQDGFLGGYLAAQYLADRGHKRVAYFGRLVPRETGLLPANRLGGALAGLLENDLELPANMRALRRDYDGDSLAVAADKLLSAKPRPTAVIALWAPFAVAVAAAADRMGLRLGEDLEIVGWKVRERNGTEAGTPFPQGYRPPTVTWSLRDMAETAVTRLEMRLGAPTLPPTVLKVPVGLERELR